MEARFKGANLPAKAALQLGSTWKCATVSSDASTEMKATFRFLPLSDGIYSNSQSWADTFLESGHGLVATQICDADGPDEFQKRAEVRIDGSGSLIGKQTNECDWRKTVVNYLICPLSFVGSAE
ncbi:MAG: hypothetical protein QM765_44420 [Myxococcales bacterium]